MIHGCLSVGACWVGWCLAGGILGCIPQGFALELLLKGLAKYLLNTLTHGTHMHSLNTVSSRKPRPLSQKKTLFASVLLHRH